MCDFMRREKKKKCQQSKHTKNRRIPSSDHDGSQINSKKLIDFNTNTKAKHKN